MHRDTPSSRPTRPDWRAFVRTGMMETIHVVSRPFFWWLLGVAVFVTAMAGPFGTFENLSFLNRLVYWGVGIVFVTLLATALSFIAYTASRARGWPWPLGALAAAVLTVPPQWVLVYGLDRAFLPGIVDGMLALLPFVAIPVIAMTMLINAVVIKVLSISESPNVPVPAALPTEGETQPQTEPSLLFQRVPPHLGRDIVCLRAQDHYLEVITPLGSALVLMRLSDAERGLSGLRGMRVHRSWWVALDHVADFSHAEGGGVSLTTTTGHTIPVARGQRAALRAALTPPERRAAE